MIAQVKCLLIQIRVDPRLIMQQENTLIRMCGCCKQILMEVNLERDNSYVHSHTH